MVESLSIPFYATQSAKRSNPAKYPDNPREVIAGLGEAIRNTEKRIRNLKKSHADISEFELHLKALKSQLEKVRKDS